VNHDAATGTLEASTPRFKRRTILET
jgi:hypothetical protein